MKSINVGDVYWMPANRSLDSSATVTRIVVTKVGTKFIYATREGSKTEYQFTFKSEGKLSLVNKMCSSTAYSEELWKKQKLIIDLGSLHQKIKADFPQVKDLTDFKKYQEIISKMNDLSQRILEHD